jgi:type 1 glutamine amidotransferase
MMRAIGRLVTLGAGFCLVGAALAPDGEAGDRPRQLLAVGMARGWQHESTSDALATLQQLGRESGLWETTLRTDLELVTKRPLEMNGKNLDFFDAVFFMTSGELPLDEEQKRSLLEFVREDGKGFLGAHSATDTLYGWPEYGELIGGYFDGHPWDRVAATLEVGDRETEATRHLPARLGLFEEFYQIREFRPQGTRVLMRLDPASVDLTRDGVRATEFPVTWMREQGRGRVFYTSLGHEPATWARDDIRAMWLGAVKWAMGIDL